jgi:ribose 5-phosphate isomerase B
VSERIAIATDHRGVALKEILKTRLVQEGHEVVDFGPADDASPVDYPDTAAPAARALANGEVTRLIVICGTGLGVMYTANRFPGVRAALVHDVETAILARQHNDANGLALSGNRLDAESAWPLVEAWLSTPFEGGRHKARIDKIDSLTRS